MPTLRVSPGGLAFGTPGQFSRDGLPLFVASAGDVAPLVVDWTAAAGRATVTAADWSGQGVGIGATSIDGQRASAMLTAGCGAVRCAATLSDGRTLSVSTRIEARP